MSQSPNPANPPAPAAEAQTPHGALFYVAGVALIAIALVGAIALSSSRRKAEAEEASARVAVLDAGARVEVGKVVLAPPGRTVTMSGEVRPYLQTTLYAKLSGYLKHVPVEKGDHVRAGEVLGIIESPEAEQDVASKKADLAVKKLTDKRDKSLVHDGLITQQDVDQASANVEIAAAELSRVSVLRNYEVIRAPFAGVITTRYADEGALLQAATSSQSALPLVDVAQIDKLRIFIYLSQQDALFVHEGDATTIWTDEFPDRKITAKITRFTKQLDVRTRTMLTEIEVNNADGGLYPGVFVRVSVTLATPSVLVVPSDALVFRGGKTTAAVVRDGRAVFVPVEVGEPDGKMARLLSGLKEGDTVVLHPGDDVASGSAVQIVTH